MKKVLKNPESGIYFLLIHNPESREISTRSRSFTVPRGYFVYVGSAQRNLSSRLKRHLSTEKNCHWHIDFLLRHARVIEIRIIREAEKSQESILAEKLAEIADFSIPGFGATDSPAAAHLLGFKAKSRIRETKIWCDAEIWKTSLT